MADVKVLGQKALDDVKNRIGRTVLEPLNSMVDQNISDITTTIGSFVIRSIRGKFQRSITFTIGSNYADRWMEEALYGILYKYNNIKKSSRLELTNKAGFNDGSGMYYRLDDGTHNLKYRNYDILLVIQSHTSSTIGGRANTQRIYTIITYNLSLEFVKDFERDMIANRNSLLKIKADAPTVNVFQDYHEGDGYTYWERLMTLNKRRLNTIYIPDETKRIIVKTINEFFANKEYYKRHGIAHNLKILLYGEPGPQPVSIEIPTPDGMKRFGDIKPGDYVFALNGQPTMVEEVYKWYNLDVYEIEFNDGRKVKCSPEHKWPVLTSRGNILEKSVYDMLNEGILDERGRARFSIPLGGEAYFPYREIPIDPWVLGVFIGNGSLRQNNVLTLTSPDAIIPQYIAVKIGAKVKKRSKDPNDYNWCFYHEDDTPIKPEEFFSKIPELINSYSKNKVIPENYIFNTRDNRYALLQGLMDTDGSIKESDSTNKEYKRYDISFCSTSKELVEQIVFLVRSLGFAASINVDKRSEKYTSGYCATVLIHCSDIDKHLFFRYSHKVDRAFRARFQKHEKRSERNPTLIIKNITNLGYKEDMHCLHVRDKWHLYQTTDFAVTCNTGKDSIAKMIASEWNRNLYYCTGGKDGKFIPNAITDNSNDVNYPLFLISDLDKYPFLINEPDIKLDDDSGSKEEKMKHKQAFGNMINALDGILSGEDRIIIMTTNHIEKFSDVILRPGRIDLKLYITYVTPEVFRRYVYDFYHTELPADIKIKKDITVANMQADVVFMKLSLDEFLKKYTVKK